MTSEHSPLPWKLDISEHRISRRMALIATPNGQMTIDATGSGVNFKQDAANAAFIVRCVNSHDALVNALRGILEIGKRDMSNPKYDGYFESAREALAKAEETAQG